MKISFERIRKGLMRSEFKPYYQPQWNSDTRTISRAEILIRWQYGTKVLLTPISFLQDVSNLKLMSTLGYYLLESVCRDLNTTTEKNLPLDKIGINFSYLELVQPGFFSMIQTTLQRYQIPASTFIIEITESSAFSDLDKLEEIILKLRKIGFSFALDDFCTGFSCFSHIDKLSIDSLKLDRLFVNKIRSGNRCFHICKGMVEIAKHLGLEVTAEGVETVDQKLLLEEIGCNYLQGFYFGQAMPFELLKQHLGSNLQNVYKFQPTNRANTTSRAIYAC